MSDEAGTRLFAIAMLHGRKEDRHGVFCDECAQGWPCRTVRLAAMAEDVPAAVNEDVTT